MSEKSRGLFHSRLATLVNLHRVMPSVVVDAALVSEAPLNSVEGFVRQMIWREYVRHIHEVTDGFRTLDVNRSTSVRGARWEGFSADDEDAPQPSLAVQSASSGLLGRHQRFALP